MLKESRYRYTRAVTDSLGRTSLTDRVPLRYVDAPDNITHIVQEGERMEDIAQRYYSRFDSDVVPAASLAWVLRDFQPIPIIDPTLRLKAGTPVFVPSENFVAQRVFDPRRGDL